MDPQVNQKIVQGLKELEQTSASILDDMRPNSPKVSPPAQP